jgi:hypothetical protein
VIEAIAGGRNAASAIDKFLGGDGDISEVLVDREPLNPFIGHIDGFAGLARTEADLMGAEQRKAGFDPIEKAFSCDQAKCEAERCLQCDLRTTISKVKLWNEY